MLIRIPRPSDAKEHEITPESIYLRRREFIENGIYTGAALAALPLIAACEPAAGRSPQPTTGTLTELKAKSNKTYDTDEAQTPFKDATRYNNFYEFGTDKEDPGKNAHTLVARPWTVKVDGEVGKPGTLDVDDLMRPEDLEERIYRLRCVEAWSMVIPWIGVPLGKILKRFEPTSKAKYVAFETLVDPKQMPGQRRKILDWPYREGLRMDEAMHPLAILASGMYGRVLPNQNGAPLRLVVPWKYGFKSIKSIVRIHLTEKEPPTTWNMEGPSEYGFYANVNPEVNHPRWSQKRERRIGEFRKRPTLKFNGYIDEVETLYSDMDLSKSF